MSNADFLWKNKSLKQVKICQLCEHVYTEGKPCCTCENPQPVPARKFFVQKFNTNDIYLDW